MWYSIRYIYYFYFFLFYKYTRSKIRNKNCVVTVEVKFKKKLIYIGTDDFSRRVFEEEDGSLGSKRLFVFDGVKFYTVDKFGGEPDIPVDYSLVDIDFK